MTAPRRSRYRAIRARVTQEEYAAWEAAAEDASLTISSYIRSLGPIAPQTEARHRADALRQELALLRATLGRATGQANQISHALNCHHIPDSVWWRDVGDALRHVAAKIDAALNKGGRHDGS